MHRDLNRTAFLPLLLGRGRGWVVGSGPKRSDCALAIHLKTVSVYTLVTASVKCATAYVKYATTQVC